MIAEYAEIFILSLNLFVSKYELAKALYFSSSASAVKNHAELKKSILEFPIVAVSQSTIYGVLLFHIIFFLLRSLCMYDFSSDNLL